MRALPLMAVNQPWPEPLRFDGRRKKNKDGKQLVPSVPSDRVPKPIGATLTAMDGFAMSTDRVSVAFSKAFFESVFKLPEGILKAMRDNQWQIIGCQSYQEEGLPYIGHAPGSRGVADPIQRYILIPEQVQDVPNARKAMTSLSAQRDLQEDIFHEAGHAVDRLSAQKPVSQVLPRPWFVVRALGSLTSTGLAIASVAEWLPLGEVGATINILLGVFGIRSSINYVGFYSRNLNTISSEKPFRNAFWNDIEQLRRKSDKRLRKDLPKLAYYLQHPQEAFAESFYAALSPNTPKGRFIKTQLPNCVSFIQQHILPRYQ